MKTIKLKYNEEPHEKLTPPAFILCFIFDMLFLLRYNLEVLFTQDNIIMAVLWFIGFTIFVLVLSFFPFILIVAIMGFIDECFSFSFLCKKDGVAYEEKRIFKLQFVREQVSEFERMSRQAAEMREWEKKYYKTEDEMLIKKWSYLRGETTKHYMLAFCCIGFPLMLSMCEDVQWPNLIIKVSYIAIILGLIECVYAIITIIHSFLFRYREMDKYEKKYDFSMRIFELTSGISMIAFPFILNNTKASVYEPLTFNEIISNLIQSGPLILILIFILIDVIKYLKDK